MSSVFFVLLVVGGGSGDIIGFTWYIVGAEEKAGGSKRARMCEKRRVRQGGVHEKKEDGCLYKRDLKRK